MANITPNLLGRIAQRPPNDVAEYAAPLGLAMAAGGLGESVRVAAFLAQVAFESEGFSRTVENLNYSAAGLLETFPRHFNSHDADVYAHRPDRIANRAYANRMGNGDEASGDGWRYRGRGLIQLTGREAYERCGSAIDLPLLSEPDLLVQPAPAAKAAVWFWNDLHLSTYADAGKFREISRRINGGDNGAEGRATYLARARLALGIG